jgi:Neutral/alkaline non-lysosomal ceramidase, N-terminal
MKRMNIRQTKALIHSGFAALCVMLFGCSSIDYTALDLHPSYRITERDLSDLGRIAPAPASGGSLRVGTARIDISPPVGLPLAGYGGRTSTGVRDPIYARALAVSNGPVTVVIVSADLLAITDDLSAAVIQKVQKVVPLPDRDLLIAATNTHSGPGSMGKRFWETLAAGPYNDAVFEMATDGISRAVVEAYRSLRSATLVYGRADGGDLILNRMLKDGPTDPELSFLLFRSQEGRPIAYLINFSAHPTLLRSSNRLLSGDFPAVVSRILEDSDDGTGSVALYTSGAVADQRPNPPHGKSVYERTDRMGRELAERILKSAAGSSSRITSVVAAAKITLVLPDPQIKVGTNRRLPVWVGRAMLDGTTSIQVVRIGPVLLLGVPCDLGAEIGLALKRYARSRGFEALVVGFANDYIGYVISDKYYPWPTYEAFMSFNGPYMEDFMTGALKKTIEAVTAPQTSIVEEP